MITAAIYARKSTDQSGVADDAKSVTRQVAQASAFADSRGWAVADEHVYVDDGVSGAEFAARPGFLRLMNALKPTGTPFQVLIMSEESRLGREAIETGYALKRLISAGVRVFFYLTNTERTLDSPTDKVLMSLTAFADEMERERARQRTYDALARKAKAGYVTGGRVFGYDNVEIRGANGQRSHVERRINPAEADVIRRIFALKLQGWGYTRIAKALNADGLPAPRAQRGRPNGWATSSVLEVLRRDLYRGVIVWNKTRKRNQWGAKQVKDRAAADWLTIEAPQLAIIDAATWLAVQEQQAQRRAIWPAAANRPRDRESKFLLTGFLRCGTCGSTINGAWRGGANARWFAYMCLGRQKRGSAICANNTVLVAGHLERAILEAALSGVLSSLQIDEVLDHMRAALTARVVPVRKADVSRKIDALDRQIARLTAAIADGEPPAAVLTALREREAARAQLVTASQRVHVRQSPTVAIEQALAVARNILMQWQRDLVRDPGQLRALLERVLVGPIVVTPSDGTDAKRSVAFTGEAHLVGLFNGQVDCSRLSWRPHRDSWVVVRLSGELNAAYRS